MPVERIAVGYKLADAALARATREFSVERYRQRLSGFYAEALDQRKTTPCVDGAQKRVATTRSR